MNLDDALDGHTTDDFTVPIRLDTALTDVLAESGAAAIDADDHLEALQSQRAVASLAATSSLSKRHNACCGAQARENHEELYGALVREAGAALAMARQIHEEEPSDDSP